MDLGVGITLVHRSEESKTERAVVLHRFGLLEGNIEDEGGVCGRLKTDLIH